MPESTLRILELSRVLCFRTSSSCVVRELADTGFVSVQNFVKLGLYLKK